MTPRAPIEIAVEDGITLRGETRPGGRLWAVLVHDQGEDLDHWRNVPEQLARLGVGVIAIDLRGHGGSDGRADPASVRDDLEAAIDAARSGGAEAVVAVAAGATAAVALNQSSADAVVAITPTLPDTDPLPERPFARLLVVTREPAAEAAASELQAQPGRRTLVARVPVDDTGLALLAGDWGSNVVSYILAFVRRLGLELQRGPGHPDRISPGGDP
jgi:pimeloyl-ACP methyl ester carboxylesterase